MPVDKINVEKINIRNPFYITADGEGAPDLPATESDPVDDPDVPAIYVPPAQVTQAVQCGDEVNVGSDVGGKIYTLNVGSTTGNVTVNYTVNVPISITAFWNTSVPTFSTTDYVGNNIFEQELLDAGISSGSMSLSSGVQTGTVTVNKTAATPETVSFLVSAPLQTDDYKLVFNCPAAPSISAPAGNVPSTTPSHTGFVEQIPAFFIQHEDSFNGKALFDVQMKVNDVTVVSNFTTTGWHVFTDYNGVANNFGIGRNYAEYGGYGFGSSNPTYDKGYTTGSNNCLEAWTTPTTYYAQSTYFTSGLNKIEFIYTLKGTAWPQTFRNGGNSINSQYGVGPFVRYVKTGLFYDNINSEWRYPMDTSDESDYDWRRGSPYFNNNQNNDTLFIGNLEGVLQTTNPYGGDKSFGGYGIPVKYTQQFFWRSTPTAGLDNPYRPNNTYYNSFAGKTYRILLDDGAGGRDAQIITSKSSGTRINDKWCSS